jgi:hypothetical protein
MKKAFWWYTFGFSYKSLGYKFSVSQVINVLSDCFLLSNPMVCSYNKGMFIKWDHTLVQTDHIELTD